MFLSVFLKHRIYLSHYVHLLDYKHAQIVRVETMCLKCYKCISNVRLNISIQKSTAYCNDLVHETDSMYADIIQSWGFTFL